MFQRDSVSVAIISETLRRYMRIAIRPAVLRNLLVLVTLVLGTLGLLYFSRPVSAANKFWIATAPGNFNVDANWSTSSGGPANTTAPGLADLAIFDGNGLGNCTIPVDTTVTGIQINAGYTTGPATGTILQGTSNLTLSGAFTQADGTFTGGSGAMDFNGNFTLSAGTFTASSTTTSFASNFTPRGTFAPNGGTVVFDGGSDTAIDLGAAPGVAASLTLNNLTVNKTGGGGRVIISGDPDTLVVAGTLTLTDGVVLAGGVLEAQGALSIASTFDGGAIILLISGAATRTVTLGAGVLLPPLTVNAPNVTVNTSGAGAITFTQPVNVQSVASFTNGTVDFVFNAGVVFTQSGGTFTGGSGLIDFNATFTLSGGTFTASSTTTSFASTFTPRGTFNSNGGTVVFDGAGDTAIDLGAAPGVPGSLTLNNVTVNKTGGGGRVIIQGDPDTLVVAGTLTLTDGVVLAGGVNATLEAQGDLSIASTFGGGNIILLISGAATRTVVLGAGALLPRLTVNAPNVTVNTSGTGAITFTQPVNIQSVALFANGAVDFIFNDTGVVFTQSGGTFTGGSGLIDFNGNFTLSGGTFTASSTTTSFAATFTKTGGTFNPNGGTVVFDGSGESLLNVSPPTLNNLTVNKPTNVAVVLNFQETLVVAGTLTLTNGVFDKNGALSTATLEAQGDVAIASTFDGGSVNFRFGGSANQTFTNGGGLNVTGSWTVDKPAGAVTLASNLILTSNQPLTITSGILNQGASLNLEAGPIAIGSGGKLTNQGSGDLTLRGNLTNAGTITLNGAGGSCGDADSILIRSSVDGTQRTWSGSGNFFLTDVDLKDQSASTPPGTITVFNGTDSGNNANFSFVPTCNPTAADSAISGRIVAANGSPVEGAVVRLNGTQNRRFITDANGFYRFDNVEANGFYTVTPARVNYSFSPSARSFSQLGLQTDAGFTASANGGALNPLDTTEYLVRQQYVDFLGREPDEAGFNFWVNNIEACGADLQCREVLRINTSAAFFLSIEFQHTGYLVHRLYLSAYGDIPDTPVPVRLGEFRADSQAIGKGVIVNKIGWEALLESNKQAFTEEFVQRARFLTAFPASMTPAQFVDTLNQNAANALSQSERDQLVNDLTTGAKTRAQVLRAVAEDPDLNTAEFNRAFVLMQYFGYLRRNPNDAPELGLNFDGYNFWLNKLIEFNGNFVDAEMVKAFITSGEYRQRFKP